MYVFLHLDPTNLNGQFANKRPQANNLGFLLNVFILPVDDLQEGNKTVVVPQVFMMERDVKGSCPLFQIKLNERLCEVSFA